MIDEIREEIGPDGKQYPVPPDPRADTIKELLAVIQRVRAQYALQTICCKCECTACLDFLNFMRRELGNSRFGEVPSDVLFPPDPRAAVESLTEREAAKQIMHDHPDIAFYLPHTLVSVLKRINDVRNGE